MPEFVLERARRGTSPEVWAEVFRTPHAWEACLHRTVAEEGEGAALFAFRVRPVGEVVTFPPARTHQPVAA